MFESNLVGNYFTHFKIGCVAAITTLGGPPSEGTGQRVDYAGNSNVIEQAGILGVERIILVTSVGCGNTAGAIPQHVYQALEGALVAKSKAERDLKMYTNLVTFFLRSCSQSCLHSYCTITFFLLYLTITGLDHHKVHIPFTFEPFS